MNKSQTARRIPARLKEVISEELASDLSRLRQDLHQHPELSSKEERTSATLYECLERLQPAEIARVAGTAVVARIKGKSSSAPTVAIRGDIDALPIQEDTGLEWASVNQGVMHACGHDVHASWAVGAANLLSQAPAAGDVLILLQPAEETAMGAQAVLESGALDGVSAIFGGHVDRRYPVGQVVVQEGALAASADSFSVRFKGQGAHGARPHEGSDPIVGLGALIGALQTIVSRRLDPAVPAVVTIGRVEGGMADNIIPGEARLSGTLRATDPDTRQKLYDEIDRIAVGIAEVYSLEAKIEIHSGPPPIVNPTEPTGWVRDAVEDLLGKEAAVPLGTANMGGEDFAFYLERIPGCFFRVGAREVGTEFIPAHSPRFYAAEESLYIGAAVLAETARIASAALAGR